MGENMTNLEMHLINALERIAEPKAFFVSTSKVDPEAYARMVFAEKILKGLSVKNAEKVVELDTRLRYLKGIDCG